MDTYTKVAHCKLYKMKTSITAADLLNDRVLPFYEKEGVGVLRVLTDRGTEFCGKPDSHEYELYLAILTIRRQRQGIRKLMASVRGSIKLFYRSFIK